VAKKSFNDFTLPTISKLYGKDAKLTPAKNEPIANGGTSKLSKYLKTEKENKEKRKHQDNAKRNKISTDSAAYLIKGGRRYLLENIAIEINPKPVIKDAVITERENALSVGKVAKTKMLAMS